ncbi:MAG TPA: hypothetical protein VJ456_11720 [Acidimicrobiia bacterium]|nr:hypothetical protein [Acidimicrobiia bacterium]
MLGELLSEDRGQITNTRVLPSEPGQGPRLEISFESHGTLLGIDYQEVATYTGMARPDGTILGEGQGLVTSSSGDLATWRGTGVGHMTETGGTEFRGAIYFETASANWARLNGVAGVFEYAADASGKTESKVWEWK